MKNPVTPSRAVVGPDHQRAVLACHRVLGDHPQPGLHVAAVVVLQLPSVLLGERHIHPCDGLLNVERMRLVRSDELQGPLGVLLVLLAAVRQPHRMEDGLAALAAELLDGQLAESPRQG